MALTMRGRYLMREYWADSDLFLKLTAEEREFYQGLWMLADDSGFLPKDVPEIAANLLRFEDRTPREAKTRLILRRLGDIGKVKSLRCCVFLPAVARYPRAGRKSDEHERNHQNHSKGFEDSGANTKDIQRDLNPSPVPSLPDEVRSRGRASANGETKGGLRSVLGDYSDVVKSVS